MKDISKLSASVAALLDEPEFRDIPLDLVEDILRSEADHVTDRVRGRESVQSIIARYCSKDRPA